MSNKTSTPIMDQVWDSCGDYEKPLPFAKRVYVVGQRLETQREELISALRIIRNQSLGSDWTADQAVEFIKKHADDALAKAGAV